MNFKTYTYNELDSIVFELKNNKAVIIPTDTVIGVLANNDSLIYQIKNRPKEKKIILFVSDIKDLGILNKKQKQFLEKFWPGQVTIIKDGVSYRMPNDDYLLYILSKTGPLYSSSANVSGKDTIVNTDQANKEFNVNKFFYSLVLVKGKSKGSTPSTIVNIDNWQILREGCKINEVKEFINNLKESKKEVYILSDDINFDSHSKLMNKFAIDEGLNLIHLKLNNKNLEFVSNKLRSNPNIFAFILTKDPLKWDVESNKLFLIRSALIYNVETAQLSKQHDNANIAIIDTLSFNKEEVLNFMRIYLQATFEGGRHEARVNTIIDYEKDKTNH